jgi:hypothetical protein
MVQEYKPPNTAVHELHIIPLLQNSKTAIDQELIKTITPAICEIVHINNNLFILCTEFCRKKF